MIHPEENEPQGANTFAHVSRLREVSVQAMIEGSARARLGRAMNTRTTISAQTLNLKIGEEDDFYREQHQKDTPGWFGPATVIDVSHAARGTYSVRWGNRILEVRLQDIRRHLYYFTFLCVQQDADRGHFFPTMTSEAYPLYTTMFGQPSKRT